MRIRIRFTRRNWEAKVFNSAEPSAQFCEVTEFLKPRIRETREGQRNGFVSGHAQGRPKIYEATINQIPAELHAYVPDDGGHSQCISHDFLCR